jgi:hypothetical protein
MDNVHRVTDTVPGLSAPFPLSVCRGGCAGRANLERRDLLQAKGQTLGERGKSGQDHSWLIQLGYGVRLYGSK